MQVLSCSSVAKVFPIFSALKSYPIKSLFKLHSNHQLQPPLVNDHRPEWGDIILDFHAWRARHLKRNRLSIKRPDNKKNGLKMTNSAHMLQTCESILFASKMLACGFCRWDMDLYEYGSMKCDLFEILAQAELIANFTRNSPIFWSFIWKNGIKIFQCRIFVRLSVL